MKKVQLEKQKGLKIMGQMKQAATPGRYGKAADPAPSRRERRRQEQALGRVPFAVKLDAELVQRLHALAAERQCEISEVAAELLRKGLDG